MQLNLLISLIIFLSIGSIAKSQTLCEYYLDQSHHYTYEGDYEKAVEVANKAIKRYPDTARCYFERGGAYFFMDSLDEAYMDFDRYIDMKPQNSDGYHWRGIILLQSRVFDEAEADFLKCISLGSTSDLIKEKLAESRLFQNKLDLAEVGLKELVEKNPKKISYYNTLGLLYERKKDYATSKQYFTQALALDPNDPGIYYNRARVYMTTQDKDAACNDWVAARRLGIEDADIWMDANNCAGLKGLKELDKQFDKQERYKGSKNADKTITLAANYFPMLSNAAYTYKSEHDGKIDTAAMSLLRNNYVSNDYHIDLGYRFPNDMNQLYFELFLSDDFRKNGDKLAVLVNAADNTDYPVPFFPRDFTFGKEEVIENTWNPGALFDMKRALLSVEGLEPFKMPDGKMVETVKLRIEIEENNGRNILTYLWLVNDFGLVKWRQSTGQIWEIIRYAVPDYGSFPEEEDKHLQPPPKAIQVKTEIKRN